MELLSQEDKDFIKNLSNEMNTQDTRCTAQPYALVIRNKTRQIRDFNNCENKGVYWDEYEYDGFEEFKEAFERYYLEDSETNEAVDFIREHIKDIDDLKNYEHKLNRLFDLDINAFGYEDVMTADSSKGMYEGNFFLTEKACKEHIEQNSYHFREPDTYGIHLTRNSEMEQLIKIVHKLASNFNENI